MTAFCTDAVHDWAAAPFPPRDDFDYDSLLGTKCCCGEMVLVPGPLAGCKECLQAPVAIDSIIAMTFLAWQQDHKTISGV